MQWNWEAVFAGLAFFVLILQQAYNRGNLAARQDADGRRTRRIARSIQRDNGTHAKENVEFHDFVKAELDKARQRYHDDQGKFHLLGLTLERHSLILDEHGRQIVKLGGDATEASASGIHG